VLDLEKYNEMFTTYKLLGLGREQTTKGHIQARRKTYREKEHALPYLSAKTTDFKPNNLVIQRNNTPPLLPTYSNSPKQILVEQRSTPKIWVEQQSLFTTTSCDQKVSLNIFMPLLLVNNHPNNNCLNIFQSEHDGHKNFFILRLSL